jgi:geranylgeranyl reductase family protein
MDYDAIVIGAGPAGSMAAYNCAKAGLQTLLLDKAKFPREKPCGGAVSVRSLKALKLVGIRIPSSIIEQKIFGLRFMGPEMKPFEYHSKRLVAYTVKRERFDHFLVQCAVKAGAQFRMKCALKNLEQQHDFVRCHTENGDFTARVVIGADGASSRVGRIVNLRKPVKADEIGVAVECQVPISSNLWNQGLNPSLLEFWLFHIPNGYFWVFPRRESLSLGVGGIAGKCGNLPNLLRGLTRMFCLREGLPLFKLQRLRGHQLPVFEKLIPLTSHRVFLVGDAAGFIDVFSGQGICYALESGLICAKTVTELIKHNHTLSKAASQYQTRIAQRFGMELQDSWFFMRLVHANQYGGFHMARFMKWPGKLVFDIARGRTDYYRMKRNPLNLLAKLFASELKARLMKTPGQIH